MWVLYSAVRRKLKSPFRFTLLWEVSLHHECHIQDVCFFLMPLNGAPVYAESNGIPWKCLRTYKQVHAGITGGSVPRRRIKLGGRGSIKMQTRWTWRCRLLTFDVILGQKRERNPSFCLKTNKFPNELDFVGKRKGGSERDKLNILRQVSKKTWWSGKIRPPILFLRSYSSQGCRAGGELYETAKRPPLSTASLFSPPACRMPIPPV